MILRYKEIHAFDNNKTMKIIYSMYRADKVFVHRACCEQATWSLPFLYTLPNPTFLSTKKSL